MAMTMEELELEYAELVPAREVMCAATYNPCQHHSSGSWENNGQNSSGTYIAGGGFLSPGINVLDGNNVSVLSLFGG